MKNIHSLSKHHIVLVSKDATMPEYYGPYQSVFTKTPNIDELASKGTVFRKHYTAAPSTAMAFAAMFTGKWSYEMGYSHYHEVAEYMGETLFDKLYEQGYECHVLWSSNYAPKAEIYTKCYGKHTIFHDKMKFNQSCGFNAKFTKENRIRNEQLAHETIEKIIAEVDTIDRNKPIFLWVHMPHCLVGRISYGDDMDLYDHLIGELRQRFGDENFFVTADHGHMNGYKGKVGYGFDVYNNATHIPLIAPRMEDKREIKFPTSNVQLGDIILEHRVKKLPYILSDCAYYAQPNRKLAIIVDDWYYIYNKRTKKEELYHMALDPHQDINLAQKFQWKDMDRCCLTDIRQVILFPDWDKVEAVIDHMREIKDSVWENGTKREETIRLIRYIGRKSRYFIRGLLKNFR